MINNMFSMEDAFKKDDEKIEAIRAEQMRTNLNKVLETEGLRVLELYFKVQTALLEDNYTDAQEKRMDTRKASFYFYILRFYLPVIKEMPDINQVLDDDQLAVFNQLEEEYRTVMSKQGKEHA